MVFKETVNTAISDGLTLEEIQDLKTILQEDNTAFHNASFITNSIADSLQTDLEKDFENSADFTLAMANDILNACQRTASTNPSAISDINLLIAEINRIGAIRVNANDDTKRDNFVTFENVGDWTNADMEALQTSNALDTAKVTALLKLMQTRFKNFL